MSDRPDADEGARAELMLRAIEASGVVVEPGKRYTDGEVNAILHAAHCLRLGGRETGEAGGKQDIELSMHMPTEAAGTLADALGDRADGGTSRLLGRGGYHMRLKKAHGSLESALSSLPRDELAEMLETARVREYAGACS